MYGSREGLEVAPPMVGSDPVVDSTPIVDGPLIVSRVGGWCREGERSVENWK